ncbi:unnamed protein product [Eruca vesicaria subsp. sativa]|uniref:Uncharacterized protein n=1 Tax=Eruca vesicaria subsp. sativa TaxID=29727 RepID=A0ABC8LMG8_ERUVS|nr:unnamed protein product [Eruca vesicaria subsp. sativa]
MATAMATESESDGDGDLDHDRDGDLHRHGDGILHRDGDGDFDPENLLRILEDFCSYLGFSSAALAVSTVVQSFFDRSGTRVSWVVISAMIGKSLKIMWSPNWEYKQGGGYRGHRDRPNRELGEGSSGGGKKNNYGISREDRGSLAINTRGVQQLRNGQRRNLNEPEMLMMDAFKEPSQALVKDQEKVRGEKSSSARKSLNFETMVESTENELVHQEPGSNVEMVPDRQLERTVDLDKGFNDQPVASDEANLMLVGVLLSDSELVDEDWEDGELPDFLDEMEGMQFTVNVPEATHEDNIPQEDTNAEEGTAKVAKKKSSKAGINRTRLVHKLLSPKKGKISKPALKNGDKGNGEGKKNGGKH